MIEATLIQYIIILSNGKGVQRNIKKAKLVQIAAQYGNADAMNEYGKMFYIGK